ncbi:MAG: DUF4249 family protein [Bacteroidales bacterium]|nr:DUF4249 family protein [Bacteroidales bacterium]
MIAAAAYAALMASCVEPVDFSPAENLPLSVHCILTRDSVQTLSLKVLSPHGTAVPQALPDGIRVMLSGKGQDECWEFRRNTESEWACAMVPEYGGRYSLSVSTADREILSAETTFPQEFYVKQFMKIRPGLVINYLYCSCELRIRRFYHDYYTYEDLRGAAYRKSANLWIFHKEGQDIATTHPLVDDFNQTEKTVGELPCFRKDSVKLWKTSIFSQKIWIRDKYSDLPMHSQMVRLRFPTGFTNGYPYDELNDSPLYSDQSFILITDYPRDYEPTEGGIFDIYAVSDELDLYLKDIYQKEQNKGRDIRYVYDHDNVYSNIQGGTGVFGALVYREQERALRGYKDDFK